MSVCHVVLSTLVSLYSAISCNSSQTLLTTGIVFGFAAGLISGGNSWRYMFLLGGILPTVMIFLVVYVMPETPRWLITKDRDSDAIAVLTQVYPEGMCCECIELQSSESVLQFAVSCTLELSAWNGGTTIRDCLLSESTHADTHGGTLLMTSHSHSLLLVCLLLYH